MCAPVLLASLHVQFALSLRGSCFADMHADLAASLTVSCPL